MRQGKDRLITRGREVDHVMVDLISPVKAEWTHASGLRLKSKLTDSLQNSSTDHETEDLMLEVKVSLIHLNREETLVIHDLEIEALLLKAKWRQQIKPIWMRRDKEKFLLKEKSKCQHIC